MRRWSMVGVLLAIASACGADSLKAGEQEYKDVYVMTGASMYYVCLPESGSVVSIEKGKVAEGGVVITADDVARQEIKDRFYKTREAQQKPATPILRAEAPAAPAEAKAEKAPAEKAKPKELVLRGTAVKPENTGQVIVGLPPELQNLPALIASSGGKLQLTPEQFAALARVAEAQKLTPEQERVMAKLSGLSREQLDAAAMRAFNSLAQQHGIEKLASMDQQAITALFLQEMGK